MKPEVRIEEWFVAFGQLHGKAFGHPRFSDGTRVITSAIVTPKPWHFKSGDKVETRNTVYLLGEPA